MSTVVVERPPLGVRVRLYLGRAVPAEWRRWAVEQIKAPTWRRRLLLYGVMPWIALLFVVYTAPHVVMTGSLRGVSLWPMLPIVAGFVLLRSNRRFSMRAALNTWRRPEDKPHWYDFAIGSAVAGVIVVVAWAMGR